MLFSIHMLIFILYLIWDDEFKQAKLSYELEKSALDKKFEDMHERLHELLFKNREYKNIIENSEKSEQTIIDQNQTILNLREDVKEKSNFKSKLI